MRASTESGVWAPNGAKFSIVKEWDENERVHEAGNGRLYVSQGRFVWFVLDAEGALASVHDRKREALAWIAAVTR